MKLWKRKYFHRIAIQLSLINFEMFSWYLRRHRCKELKSLDGLY